METPSVLFLSVWFFLVVIKVSIILTAPFALALIVRLRSQGGKKYEEKPSQTSHKTEAPSPSGNPDSDGEDKPDESYWTRFKKWCSDNSVYIGLGCALVTLTLVYIYRENISELFSQDQPPEEKKEEQQSVSVKKKVPKELNANTLASEYLTENREGPATTLGDHYCPFIEKEGGLTVDVYLESKVKVIQVFNEIKKFYEEQPEKNSSA